MTKKRKIILTSIIIIIISLLSYLGIISINGICGYKPTVMLLRNKKNTDNSTKSWECHCIGFKEGRATSYTETTYCTGINLSSPKVSAIFFPNTQYPVSK